MVLAALIVGGCAGDPVDPCRDLPPDGGTLTIGGSPESGVGLEAYEDGTERALIRGNQGGFHVWMTLSARDVCWLEPRVESRVYDETTGDMVLFQSRPTPLEPVEGEPGASDLRSAATLILCPSPFGDPVAGRMFRVEARIVDRDGRTAEAEKRFVATCDPEAQGGAFHDDCLCQCGDGDC